MVHYHKVLLWWFKTTTGKWWSAVQTPADIIAGVFLYQKLVDIPQRKPLAGMITWLAVNSVTGQEMLFSYQDCYLNFYLDGTAGGTCCCYLAVKKKQKTLQKCWRCSCGKSMDIPTQVIVPSKKPLSFNLQEDGIKQSYEIVLGPIQ